MAVPINVRLHPREVGYILEQSLATAVIHGDFINPRIPQARRETSVRHWISTGDLASADSLGYEDLLAQGPELPDDVELDEDALAWLFYTSGTTGKPKGAMLSHRNLLAMTMSFFADHYVPDETDVALHAAPLSHGSGLYALPLVARAVTNILHDSVGFSPALVFEEITRWKVTLIPFLAPTQVKRLAEAPIGPGHDLSSLRAIAWGGAPMYVEDARRAVARFGPILTELYGLGESPMTITALSRRAMAAELEKAPGAADRGAAAHRRGSPRCGRSRPTAARGKPRRGPGAGRRGHEGVLEQPAGHGRDLARGLAAHRGHRLPGQTGVSLPGGPQERHDPLRGIQHLSARGRGSPDGAPPGGRGGRVRRTRSGVGGIGEGRRQAPQPASSTPRPKS